MLGVKTLEPRVTNLGWFILAFAGFGLSQFSEASAQCTLTANGPLPWTTCGTWTGPTWQAYADPQPIVTGIDLNGDGLGDLAFVDPSGVHIATSNGSSFPLNGQSVAGGAPLPGQNLFGGGLACYTGNFDGSGRSSVACLRPGSIALATSNGTGFNGPSTQSITANNLYNAQSLDAIVNNCNGNGVCHVVLQSPVSNACAVMDINGDGRDDIVCGFNAVTMVLNNNNIPQPSIAWGVYLSSGAGFIYQTWNGSSGGFTFMPNCIAGDFNGDGLSDLACNFNGQTTWNMLFSTGTGWSVKTWANGPSAAYGFVPNEGVSCLSQLTNPNGNLQSCPNPCVVGDFDGDGIQDIACPESTTTWAIGFGGGNAGFKNNKSVTWTGPTPLNGNVKAQGNCVAADVYGSGRSGLVCLIDNKTSWAYLASTGAAFATTTFTTPWNAPALNPQLANYGVFGTVASNCVIADFNGDGVKDIACHGQTLLSNFNATTSWYIGLSSRPN